MFNKPSVQLRKLTMGDRFRGYSKNYVFKIHKLKLNAILRYWNDFLPIFILFKNEVKRVSYE